MHVESIYWELAIKPGYYTIIVQYTQLMFVRRITVFRDKGTLARGKHPLSTLFRAPQVSPGESTHISRTSVSPEVDTLFGHRVSGTSPKAGLVSGKFPTRQRCLPCGPTGCLFLNIQLGRVSPYEYESSPPLFGLCQIWCVACRNRPTNHLITNLDP